MTGEQRTSPALDEGCKGGLNVAGVGEAGFDVRLSACSRLARFQTCVTRDCGLRTTIHAGDANECRPEVAADASNPTVKRDFQILIN